MNKKENRDKIAERLQPSEEQEQVMRLRAAMLEMQKGACTLGQAVVFVCECVCVLSLCICV